MPKYADLVPEAPATQARRLYYDTLVYDKDTLAFLIERFGVTQLCIGTDHPFLIQEKDPLAAIDALGLGAAERRLLTSANAERFLGEPESQ
jgi:aminocarboxymuconate-semialdehyde decarboxylase